MGKIKFYIFFIKIKTYSGFKIIHFYIYTIESSFYFYKKKGVTILKGGKFLSKFFFNLRGCSEITFTFA